MARHVIAPVAEMPPGTRKFLSIDGRPIAVLGAGRRLEARFVHNQGSLAQLAGVSFYGRLHQKFGRLATLR